MPERFKFETLNTSFVNLAALIRYLREQEFFGKVHVELDQYEAYVFFMGLETPDVWEHDHATGRDAEGEGALQRLLVRAREPGGTISAYEEDQDDHPEPKSAADHFSNTTIVKTPSSIPDADELNALASLSAHIIVAIERAVQTTGMSFADQFHIARVEIGDDYPFLDPTVGGFEYEKSAVTLTAQPAPLMYVQAVCEALKRVVNRVAKRQNESSFRERVAVELAMAARLWPNGLGEFTTQLDKIAGTRVL